MNKVNHQKRDNVYELSIRILKGEDLKSVAELYVNRGRFCKFDIIKKKCPEILPYARASGRWTHRK